MVLQHTLRAQQLFLVIPQSAFTGDSELAMVVFIGNSQMDQEQKCEFIFAIRFKKYNADMRILTLLSSRSLVERRVDNVLCNPCATSVV